jgi:hypothetical protein
MPIQVPGAEDVLACFARRQPQDDPSGTALALCRAYDTNDSASMNIWLHKQVMAKLAANGGRVPAELRD